MLLTVAIDGNIEEVRKTIEKRADVNANDNNGNTALDYP